LKASRGTPDFILLFITLVLVGFGLVMVFSASFTISYWKHDNQWYITQRQLIWAIIGIVVMFFSMNIPFSFYRKKFFTFLVISFVMLILVFIPGLGMNINGASSWLRLGPLSIQPSEFAKLGLIVYLAALITKKGDKMKDFKYGLLPSLLITSVFFIIIALQPDYGTAMILLATSGIMIMVGGANFKHIMRLAVPAVSVLAVFILSESYRISRFTAYLDPWKDPYKSGYQLIQSLMALGNGGVTGTGFGKGIQKYFYLPYPQSDFIFSVMGEELGFIGITIFILGFLGLIWRILFIALSSKDSFGTLVGVGIASLLSIQAFINIGGVTGTIPITGVPLPFISAGGSSLIMVLMGIGIILSLSRENNKI